MLAEKMLEETTKTLASYYAKKSVPRGQRRAELEIKRKLASLFGEVGQGTVRELKRIGRVPSDEITKRKLVDLINKSGAMFRRIFEDGAVDAGRYGRRRAMQLIQQAGLSVTLDRETMELPDRVKEEMLEEAFEASERTMRRVRGDVMSNLSISYEEGLGIDEAAQRLEREFENLKTWEAERIARTETNCYQNKGAYRTMVDFEVEYVQWWTAEDERVREDRADHVELHGQIIERGDTFSNRLRYPGDRSGGESTIEEWINCRCRLVPFIIPEGYRPPDNMPRFREEDLIPIDEDEPEPLSDEAMEEIREEVKKHRSVEKKLDVIEKRMEEQIRKGEAKGMSAQDILPDYKGKQETFSTDALANKLSEPKSRMYGPHARKFDNACDFLERRVDPRVHNQAGLPNEIGAHDSMRYRSSYIYSGENKGRINWNANRTQALVHEYGHFIDFEGSHDTQRITEEFFNRRTQGESMVNINGREGEVGYRDHFITPYVGRVYGDLKGLEVMSVGLEYMYHNPEELLRLDREHFKVIYAVMRGVLT